nr:B1 protein-like [Leptinotarsa decemlineata]
MKTILIFFCVAIAAMAHQITPEEKERLRQVYLACQADPKTYCDEDLLKKFGENAENKQVGIHMLCMSVNAGLQTKEGDLLKDFIRTRIDMVTHDKSKVDEYLEKCAVLKETPEKTAVQLWLCFIKNDIKYYHKL